jgi:signal transduction histidine kinase
VTPSAAELHQQIVASLRDLMARILEPRLDLEGFLAQVAVLAKQLNPQEMEARVYEVDFVENQLTLKTSTQVDVGRLAPDERRFTIVPQTITGDATIENRVIVATRREGYNRSRFKEGEDVRAAFPIEFYDEEIPEGRTKYLLVIDKKGEGPIDPDVIQALRDYVVLSGLAISIKEIRDKLSQYYEENRNLVLTGRHSAAIGHDIRSLNIGVGGYLKMAGRLLEGDLSEEDRQQTRKYIQMAEDNAGQIEALLGSFSQFNRTKVTMDRNTDLSRAVADKIEALTNRLDFSRNVEFDVKLTGRVGLLVDPDWFGTVVENLVRNSVEACGGPTRIKVRDRRENNQYQLVLEDNCGGVPPDLLPDLFMPFSSGKKTGQGLGLANVKRVVEDHGGRIRIQNVNGRGARFTIEFDLDDSGDWRPAKN